MCVNPRVHNDLKNFTKPNKSPLKDAVYFANW